MIIDFHSHVDYNSGYVDALLRRMDLVGIDKIVVFAPDNKQVEKAVNQHPDRLVGFVFIHPLYKTALDDLKYYIEEAGFRGVKMAPTGDFPKHYYPNDVDAYPVYEAIAKLDVPLLYHMGVIFRDPSNPSRAKVKYCLPIYLDDIARDIPELKIVVAHGGRPFIDQTISLCVCPNVYIDITWSQLPLGFWRRAVEDLLMAFGPDRLIYGSDVTPNRPVLVIDRYNQARHMLEYELELDSATIRKIMGENASQLLKLSPAPRGPISMGPDDLSVENAPHSPW